jgi:hypothetical protein
MRSARISEVAVGVCAAHTGNLVAHPLRLQDVRDARVVQPWLMTMAEPVRCQARLQLQLARERDVLASGLPDPGHARV